MSQGLVPGVAKDTLTHTNARANTGAQALTPSRFRADTDASADADADTGLLKLRAATDLRTRLDARSI